MASKEDLEVLVAELQRKLEEAETKISESEEGAKDEGVVPAVFSSSRSTAESSEGNDQGNHLQHGRLS